MAPFCLGASAVNSAHFGQGSGPILLNNVQCIGYESRLTDCPFGRVSGCFHSEDAGVRCSQRTGMVI